MHAQLSLFIKKANDINICHILYVCIESIAEGKEKCVSHKLDIGLKLFFISVNTIEVALSKKNVHPLNLSFNTKQTKNVLEEFIF